MVENSYKTFDLSNGNRIRVDIGLNISAGKSAIGNKELRDSNAIAVISLINTNGEIYRHACKLSNIEKEISKMNLPDLNSSVIKQLSAEIRNRENQINKDKIAKYSVVVYNRPGWHVYEGKTSLAYNDIVFAFEDIKEDVINSIQDNIVHESVKTNEDQIDFHDGFNDDIDLPKDNIYDADNEAPYAKHESFKSKAFRGFCYGDYTGRIMEAKYRAGDAIEFGAAIKEVTKNKPKAQILFSSMLNGLVRQAITINRPDNELATILSIVGPSGCGKSELTKCFYECMFGTEPVINVDTSETKLDDVILRKGIKSTVFDDLSTQSSSPAKTVALVFKLNSGQSRSNNKQDAEPVYSQIVISSEVQSRLANSIRDNSNINVGAKYRLVEIEVDRKTFSGEDPYGTPTDEMNINKIRELPEIYQNQIISIMEWLAEESEQVNPDKIRDLYKDAIEKVKLHLNGTFASYNFDGYDRYAKKLAVYVVSALICNEALGTGFDIKAIIKELVKSVFITERIVNEDDLEEPHVDDATINQAQEFIFKLHDFINDEGNAVYFAKDPSKYINSLHIGCWKNVEKSDKKTEKELWIHAYKFGKLVEALYDNKITGQSVATVKGNRFDYKRVELALMGLSKIIADGYDDESCTLIYRDNIGKRYRVKKIVGGIKDTPVVVIRMTSALNKFKQMYNESTKGTGKGTMYKEDLKDMKENNNG